MLYFQHYPLVTDDLYMVLHTHGAQLKPMSLYEAFRRGYVLQVTDERLVFRTAYGQVDLVATEVNVHLNIEYNMMHVKCIFFSTDKWCSSESFQSNRVFQKRLGHVYD